jgi:hypothetical protein
MKAFLLRVSVLALTIFLLVTLVVVGFQNGAPKGKFVLLGDRTDLPFYAELVLCQPMNGLQVTLNTTGSSGPAVPIGTGETITIENLQVKLLGVVYTFDKRFKEVLCGAFVFINDP